MTYAADIVRLALSQRGDPYVFGAEARFTDPNPPAFDCSELVQWVCGRLAVLPAMPDGSKAQKAFCERRHTLIPVTKGIATQGALLFRMTGNPTHVAISLGNGSTIEARGRAYGVNVFHAKDRPWTHAALIPGVLYLAPPKPPSARDPRFPGRFLTQPPAMRLTAAEKAWQTRMQARGWGRKLATGVYNAAWEDIAAAFQAEKHLKRDGVVGPDTWAAAWTAPIT